MKLKSQIRPPANWSWSRLLLTCGWYVFFGILVFSGSANEARGTVVYRKGQAEPIIGRLEALTDHHVVIRTKNEDGSSQSLSIPRSEIEDLLIPEDPQRLNPLRPDQPEAYRNYAEELAEKDIDVEAVELAIRLYLIAAYHGEGEVRRSSITGAIQLARSEEEAQRLRAAAFLLDSSNNDRLTNAFAKAAGSTDQPTPAQRDALGNLLALVRQGRTTQARRQLESPTVLEALEFFSSVVTVETIEQWIRQSELEEDQLKRLLTVEIALLDFSQQGSQRSRDVANKLEPWGKTLLRRTDAVRRVDLTNATEFDPRAAIYEEGRWVERANQRP